MTQQWLRYCKLTVEGAGEAIDLSELRIRFEITQHTSQTPNVADIRITNLSDATVQKIQKEGTLVTLEAGYQASHGLIFKGQIIQKRKGRENPVDTYLDILATDGDQAYNRGVVNKTLAAGHTYKDQVNVALEAMKPFGVTAGYIANLGSKQMPRSRVLFGMARDVLRAVTISTGTSWSIQNGQLMIVRNDEAAPGGAIVLNSRTGMIGLPTQTIDGIQVKALLNPNIVPFTLLHIDQADIQDAKFDPGYLGELNNSMIPTTSDDGFYKVLLVNHSGDSCGNNWYSDMPCIRADGKGPIPMNLVSRGIAVDDLSQEAR